MVLRHAGPGGRQLEVVNGFSLSRSSGRSRPPLDEPLGLYGPCLTKHATHDLQIKNFSRCGYSYKNLEILLTAIMRWANFLI